MTIGPPPKFHGVRGILGLSLVMDSAGGVIARDGVVLGFLPRCGRYLPMGGSSR
jgi:hypothetical protein